MTMPSYLLVPEFNFPDTEKNRFYSRVKLPNKNGCMLWAGRRSTLSGNYGQFASKCKKTFTAHRYSYELFFGKIQKKLCVLHKCDNPQCVNPEHLFLGSQQDNAIDMINKGRNYSNAGKK